MWEDANANGGEWALTMENNRRCSTGAGSGMALVYEELGESDEICSAVIS
jgi:hypothetical protein